MIESIHLEYIRKHGRMYTGGGKAILLGDQRPSFGSGFDTCEDMLKSIGYDGVVSIDYDGKASIWEDLNEPVSEQLGGWADLVFDGGVLEHVCNIGQALKSMVYMCKPGGLVVHANPAHCYGDSYYGIDAQLFRDFYRANGFYEKESLYYHRGGWRTWLHLGIRRWMPKAWVERMRKRLSTNEAAKVALMKDVPGDVRRIPANDGREIRYLPPNTHVLYVGRKIADVPKITWPSQGMYPKSQPH